MIVYMDFIKASFFDLKIMTCSAYEYLTSKPLTRPYVHNEKGSLVPIILVHGSGGSQYDWKYFYDTVVKQYSIDHPVYAFSMDFPFDPETGIQQGAQSPLMARVRPNNADTTIEQYAHRLKDYIMYVQGKHTLPMSSTGMDLTYDLPQCIQSWIRYVNASGVSTTYTEPPVGTRTKEGTYGRAGTYMICYTIEDKHYGCITNVASPREFWIVLSSPYRIHHVLTGFFAFYQISMWKCEPKLDLSFSAPSWNFPDDWESERRLLHVRENDVAQFCFDLGYGDDGTCYGRLTYVNCVSYNILLCQRCWHYPTSRVVSKRELVLRHNAHFGIFSQIVDMLKNLY